MSNDEALNDVILQSRDELQRAIDLSASGVRSPHVCDSHDSLFGLTHAIARATVTLLTVQACKNETPVVNDVNQFANKGFMPKFLILSTALKPYAWPVAIACFSPNAVKLICLAASYYTKP